MRLDTQIEDLPNEKWVKIYKERYEFSNFGRTKLLIDQNKIRIGKPVLATNGYYMRTFRVDGKYIGNTIHRLIGQFFIPNPNNLPCINHKNGIKTDNRIENLEWCTYKHNNSHALVTGLKTMPYGEDSGFSKLTNKQALEIFNSKESGVKLAKRFHVSIYCVSCIKTGERWSKITGKKFIKKERHWIEYDGKRMILRDWAKLFRVNHSTLCEHLRNKSFEDIYNYYNKKHNGLY